MTKDEIQRKIAHAKGRRALPDAVLAGNAWPKDYDGIVSRMDGSRVNFQKWRAEVHEAEDRTIAELTAMLEQADG